MASQTARIFPAHTFLKTSERLSKHLKEFGRTNNALRLMPCNFQCPTVELPEPLDVAAIRLLHDARANPSQLLEQANKLQQHLWSRHLPYEEEMKRDVYSQLQSQKRFQDDVNETESVMDDFMQMVENQNSRIKKELLQKEAATMLKSWRPFQYTADNVNSYMISRLAPNFAVSLRVLFEIRKRIPQFSPESALDFGSGVGTVPWALNLIWPIQWKEILMVDASAAMQEISARLMRGGRMLSSVLAPPCFPGIYQRRFLPFPSGSSPYSLEEGQEETTSYQCRMYTYDLVIAQHSLLDVGLKLERERVLRSLWNKVNPKGFLVLVEQGTKAGFNAILEARDLLVNRNTDNSPEPHIFAPCPHALACPKSDSICNFVVEYKPFSLTKEISASKKELFSYLILSPHNWKEEEQSQADLPRIISYKSPNTEGNVAIHDLCTPQGEFRRVAFTKRRCGSDLHFYMKRAAVGDQVPVETINEAVDPLKEDLVKDDSVVENMTDAIQLQEDTLSEDSNMVEAFDIREINHLEYDPKI